MTATPHVHNKSEQQADPLSHRSQHSLMPLNRTRRSDMSAFSNR